MNKVSIQIFFLAVILGFNSVSADSSPALEPERATELDRKIEKKVEALPQQLAAGYCGIKPEIFLVTKLLATEENYAWLELALDRTVAELDAFCRGTTSEMTTSSGNIEVKHSSSVEVAQQRVALVQKKVKNITFEFRKQDPSLFLNKKNLYVGIVENSLPSLADITRALDEKE